MSWHFGDVQLRGNTGGKFENTPQGKLSGSQHSYLVGTVSDRDPNSQ